MEIRTKYQLPSVAPIPGIKFDIEMTIIRIRDNFKTNVVKWDNHKKLAVGIMV